MTVPLEPHSRGTYLYCIVIHFHIELIFSSATISLTKRQLHVSAKTSLIARRALCQWNHRLKTLRNGIGNAIDLAIPEIIYRGIGNGANQH